MHPAQRAAVLAVRLLGFFWITVGAWMLAANVLESVAEFNPSFVGYYLQTQAVRPGLALAGGLLLWLLARPLGWLLAVNLKPRDDAP